MTQQFNPKSKRQLLFAILAGGNVFSTKDIARKCEMPKAAVGREMRRLGWDRYFEAEEEMWKRK